MPRMNKRNRDKTLEWFKTRPHYFNHSTGNYICQHCGGAFGPNRICVDHKDNNNGNNNHRNLQPLCKSCNTKKNIKDPMKKQRKPRIAYKPSIPETIKRSDRIKRATIKYLETYVTPGERVHIKDAIEHICFDANAEQQAVQRALEIQTGSHPGCKWMRFAEIDDELETENVFIQFKPEHMKR